MTEEKRVKDPEEMLSPDDAGKILGVSGKTIVRMAMRGEITGYKIGGNVWKFKRGDVQQYLDDSKYTPEAA